MGNSTKVPEKGRERIVDGLRAVLAENRAEGKASSQLSLPMRSSQTTFAIERYIEQLCDWPHAAQVRD